MALIPTLTYECVSLTVTRTIARLCRGTHELLCTTCCRLRFPKLASSTFEQATEWSAACAARKNLYSILSAFTN